VAVSPLTRPVRLILHLSDQLPTSLPDENFIFSITPSAAALYQSGSDSASSTILRHRGLFSASRTRTIFCQPVAITTLRIYFFTAFAAYRL
jgi:hypothetical protein